MLMIFGAKRFLISMIERSETPYAFFIVFVILGDLSKGGFEIAHVHSSFYSINYFIGCADHIPEMWSIDYRIIHQNHWNDSGSIPSNFD